MRNALRVLLTALLALAVLASLAAQPAAAETNKLETKTEQKQPDPQDEAQGAGQPEEPPDASPPNERDPSEDDGDEQPESNESHDDPKDKDENSPSDDEPADPTDTNAPQEDEGPAGNESSDDDEESSSADESQQQPDADYICWWIFDSDCGNRPGGGYHSCGSIYINEIGYTHNAQGTGYTSIHVVPTGFLRHFGGPLEHALAWRATTNCIEVYGPRVRVSSWESIKQQFMCHALSPSGIGTGPTWDLEGYRGPNSNPIVWARTRCGW